MVTLDTASLYSCIYYVKRVIQIKLLPTARQAGALEQTMRRFNTACNWVAERAFERQLANSYALHKCPHGRRKQTGSKGDLYERRSPHGADCASDD